MITEAQRQYIEATAAMEEPPRRPTSRLKMRLLNSASILAILTRLKY